MTSGCLLPIRQLKHVKPVRQVERSLAKPAIKPSAVFASRVHVS